MEKEKLREVEMVLDKIRPALREHHGDLRVVDIKDDEVYLQFEGGCTECPIVDTTVKEVVDIAIKGNLTWVKRVEISVPKHSIL
ncbi:NifU family protein [Thermocrinis sp.]